MHPKKKKMYQSGGMADLMKMMQGGMLEMPGGGMMPKYPGGGMMPRKYDNGGEVKSDSTKVVPLDLFGMEAVLEAKRKQDAEMQNLSQTDKLRKAFGIPEGGANLDIFGIDAVLDAREAAGLSRNPLDDLKPISDKGKELLEKLRVYFGISDEPKEMPGGGMMPKKRGMVYADNGTQIPTGRSAFILKGYDNRGDNPSGKEINALFLRTPDGPKQINPQDLMEIFPDASDLFEAYEMAGIPVKKGDGGKSIIFPQLSTDSSPNSLANQNAAALRKEFGVDTMDELRDMLNISRVAYDRSRELPKIVPGYDSRLDY